MATNVYGEEERPIYPFTAIVAQNEFKTALILNAIDPKIGGVLLTGPKGTGKSTLVRAAAEIFPEIEVVDDCIFGCDPSDPTMMCESCRSRFGRGEVLSKRRRTVRVVTLPLSATEDRVIGSLDIEKAIKIGVKALEPGILAEANQNILYIDEVNLLPDHLVDMILDASASGWNMIEREGISISHPSSFVLVGSMNPEEGELRPQILDRFGLHAKAERMLRPGDRIEVIKRSEEFMRDSLAFRKKFELQQEELRGRIKTARELLPKVEVPQQIIESIARICTRLQVDGYRPDIVIMRASKALAAFNNRKVVNANDVVTASNLALSHRTRESGRKPPPSAHEIRKALRKTSVGKELLISKFGYLGLLGRRIPLDAVWHIPFLVLFAGLALTLMLLFTQVYSIPLLLQFFTQIFSSVYQILVSLLLAILAIALVHMNLKRPKKVAPHPIIDLSRITAEQMSGEKIARKVAQEAKGVIRTPSIVDSLEKRKTDIEGGEKVFEAVPESKPTEYLKRTKRSKEGRVLRGRSYLVGKRAPVVTSRSRGRYVWHEVPKEKPWDIALGPTIRAASPYQRFRRDPNLSVVIKPQDIRIKMREYRAPFSIVLLIDLSLSMISSIANLGRTITTLHENAFRRRDRVGLVVFKGDDAFVLQEPTTNLELAVEKLWNARVSDFTPMAIGMLKAWRLLRLEKQRNRDSILMLVIVSDGIANVPLRHPLSKSGRRSMLSKAQSDVLDVARRIARDEVRCVVINTSHNPLEARMREESVETQRGLLTPTEFLMEVAETAKGSYYGLPLRKEDEAIIPPELKTKGFTVASVLKTISKRS